MGYTPHPYGNQLDPDLAEPGASFWDILWANIAYSGYMRYLERGPIHPDDHGFEKCRVCSLEYRHHTCERGDKIITDHAFRRFNERLHGTAA